MKTKTEKPQTGNNFGVTPEQLEAWQKQKARIVSEAAPPSGPEPRSGPPWNFGFSAPPSARERSADMRAAAGKFPSNDPTRLPDRFPGEQP